MHPNRSAQPVALITGASRGIGAAVAHELARRGYALALAARSQHALLTLAAQLTRSGSPALPIPTDMQEPEQIDRLVRLVFAHFGRVDVLVNNAGIGGAGRRFARTSAADIDAMLATNLAAPIRLTRAVLPHMLARRSGAIILIGSVAGQIGLPTSALYSASKFGLRGFALGLRREVARAGVHVTLVAPGFIDTTMTTWLRGVPKEPPSLVARAVAEAIEHPRREIFVPGYYRLFVWLDRLAPGLIDLALRLAP